MPKFKHLFFALSIFFFAFSCKKKTDVVDCYVTGKQAATINDTLQGKVYFVRDSSLVPNATVSIAGTKRQAITDQFGSYRFTNLGVGTYDIDVLTPQNRRNQIQQFSYAGNGTTVVDLKTFDAGFYSNLKASASVQPLMSGTKYLSIDFDQAFDGGGPYVVVILSDSTGADPALVKTFDYSFNQYLGPNKSIQINIDEKKYYPTGTKVFVDVYLHYQPRSIYTDVYTKRLIYVGGGVSLTPNTFVNWP